MPRHLVAVIIPVHDRWDLTRPCLESLGSSATGDDIQVVVVDNGSTDETACHCAPFGVSIFEGRFQHLRQERNLGFAQACNLGAEHSDADFLFFLNNDTVLTQDWLPPLLRVFEATPDLGAAAPLLLYPGSNTVQHAGIVFDFDLSVEHLFEHFPGEHPLPRMPRTCQALSAAALLLPAVLFRECGGFHPGYANGYEDIDLCCAIRRQGRFLRTVPESVILHHANQTMGRFDHEAENIALLHARQPDCFVPDLHRHARDSGYEVALTPWLAGRMRPPREREQELGRRLAKPFSPAQCLELLHEEPLWSQGYDLLGGWLEARELWLEAVELLFRQGFLCPEERVFTRLLRAALKAGNALMVQECERKLTRIRALLADSEALRRKAQFLEQRMSPLDEEIADMFRSFAAARGRKR